MHRHLRKENRERYFKSIGIDPRMVVTPDLTHGGNVMRANRSMGGQMTSDVDGLITNTKNLLLTVTVADCFPVYFYDPEKRAVGIVHSGWKGTAKGIALNAVRQMTKEFGTNPEELLVGIGPGIRKCHFDLLVQEDALQFEREYPGLTSRRDDRMSIDLPGMIQEQLLRAGLKPGNIEDNGVCTFCNREEYFSYRRDRSKETEAMVAYIGLI